MRLYPIAPPGSFWSKANPSKPQETSKKSSSKSFLTALLKLNLWLEVSVCLIPYFLLKYGSYFGLSICPSRNSVAKISIVIQIINYNYKARCVSPLQKGSDEAKKCNSLAEIHGNTDQAISLSSYSSFSCVCVK